MYKEIERMLGKMKAKEMNTAPLKELISECIRLGWDAHIGNGKVIRLTPAHKVMEC